MLLKPWMRLTSRPISSDARYRQRKLLLDKLHRGFVDVCIGVSALITIATAYKAFIYFAYVRPVYNERKAAMEKQMLERGKPLDTPQIEELSD